MTLKEVLKHRNVEGRLYVSDVKRWLGYEGLTYRKALEIRNKIEEIVFGEDQRHKKVAS